MRLLIQKGIVLLCLVLVTALTLYFGQAVNPSSTQSASIAAPSTKQYPSFSLDAQIVADEALSIGKIFILEYRGQPNYRILSFDTKSLALEEVVKIPKGTLVFSMIYHQSDNSLLLAYSENVDLDANGIYKVDLNQETPSIAKLIPETPNVFYKDLAISQQNNTLLWATMVVKTAQQKNYSVIQLNREGQIVEQINDAINPVSVDETVFYLPLEEDYSRRKIVKNDINRNAIETFDVLAGQYDLDDFLIQGDEIVIATLNRTPPTLSWLDLLIPKAQAHGNHNIPARWVSVDIDSFNYKADLPLDAKIIHDSFSINDQTFIEANHEGLSLVNNQQRSLLIKSRAFRLLAYSSNT